MQKERMSINIFHICVMNFNRALHEASASLKTLASCNYNFGYLLLSNFFILSYTSCIYII